MLALLFTYALLLLCWALVAQVRRASGAARSGEAAAREESASAWADTGALRGAEAGFAAEAVAPAARRVRRLEGSVERPAAG